MSVPAPVTVPPLPVGATKVNPFGSLTVTVIVWLPASTSLRVIGGSVTVALFSLVLSTGLPPRSICAGSLILLWKTVRYVVATFSSSPVGTLA
ncbi:hypothetical protein D3C75_606470 [compost metagenome]